GPQFGRIHQVAGTAGMHHQPGVGQVLQQQAGTAGVVEVNVGDDYPVDVFRSQIAVFQRRQQAGHTGVGASIDKGGAAVLFDQVGGVEMVAAKTGVDHGDAVVEAV